LNVCFLSIKDVTICQKKQTIKAGKSEIDKLHLWRLIFNELTILNYRDMKTKKLILLISILIVSSATQGQSFLNGDFENTTAVADLINLTNGQYNGYMPNSVAFGNLNGGGINGGDMDIITSDDYCDSAAQHGNWYVALTGNGTDAISLELSSALIMGHSYTLSFYDRFCNTYGIYVSHPFKIGLSVNDSTFGDSIYTGPYPDSLWAQHTFTFVAPNNGQYITVQIFGGSVSNTWCQVDNFTIGEASSLQSVNQDNHFRVFPNPTSDVINIALSTKNDHVKFIRVSNQLGQVLLKVNNADKIDVSEFSDGLYIIELVTENNIYVTKFLKQ
jgi:hypothetical protein